MARKERLYRRLPGRPFTLLSRKSLWQGPDHLLWVHAVMMQERYKRFYYKDIQAIVLQRANQHIVWNFVWGALALLFGLVVLGSSGPSPFSTTLTVIFLAALIINIILGPACAVHLQTAVQVERIASLVRVRTAHKAMNRIRELVEIVQGPLRLEAIPAAQPAAGQTPLDRLAAFQMPALADRQSQIALADEPFKPLLHQLLCAVLLASGLGGIIQYWVSYWPVVLCKIFFLALTVVMAAVALARWHRHIKGTFLSKISWLTLVLVLIQSVVSYGFYMATIFRHPDLTYNQGALFKAFLELQMNDHPGAVGATMAFAVGSLLLGILGLIGVHRRTKRPSGSASSEKEVDKSERKWRS